MHGGEHEFSDKASLSAFDAPHGTQMKAYVASLLVRLGARIGSSNARHGWRTWSGIERAAGFEGIVRVLEDSHGEGAVRLLRAGNARIGENVRVLRGLTIHNGEGDFANLTVGNRCHLGRQLFLDLAMPIALGDRVTVSMRVTILTHMDVGDSASQGGAAAQRRAGVTLEDDVYVGAGALILPGVIIGRCAIIGAGAVVTRSVQPGSIVAGVPARPIRG